MPNPLTPRGTDAEVWDRVSSPEACASDDRGGRPKSFDVTRRILEKPRRSTLRKASSGGLVRWRTGVGFRHILVDWFTKD